jgi:hypothetical protein
MFKYYNNVNVGKILSKGSTLAFRTIALVFAYPYSIKPEFVLFNFQESNKIPLIQVDLNRSFEPSWK